MILQAAENSLKPNFHLLAGVAYVKGTFHFIGKPIVGKDNGQHLRSKAWFSYIVIHCRSLPMWFPDDQGLSLMAYYI